MKTGLHETRHATPRTARLVTSSGAATLGLAFSAWFFVTGGAPTPDRIAEVSLPARVATLQTHVAEPLTGPAAEFVVRTDDELARPRLLHAPIVATASSALDAQLPATARPAPRAGSESAYHDAFLSLAASRTDGLDLEFARGVLQGDGPSAEKIALLRAMDDLAAPAHDDALGLALADEGALPEFAVRTLAARAADDAHARDMLEDVVRGLRPVDDPSLRRRAASHWAAAADRSGIVRLLGLMDVEQDALLVAGVAQTLRAREVPLDLVPLVDRLVPASTSSSSDG